MFIPYNCINMFVKHTSKYVLFDAKTSLWTRSFCSSQMRVTSTSAWRANNSLNFSVMYLAWPAHCRTQMSVLSTIISANEITRISYSLNVKIKYMKQWMKQVKFYGKCKINKLVSLQNKYTYWNIIKMLLFPCRV